MNNVVHGITVDYSRDEFFDELGLTRLKESYMMEGEVSPQERFAFVSSRFGTDKGHAQRLYGYSSKHWLSYSTPILSYGRNKRGLPVSCYLSLIDDTADGLVDALSEVNWLSMMGGGVGIHVGIRGADEKSVGVMPHLKVYDSSCLAYKQGTTRRGSYAAFLDISHPDVIQFLEMRKPTGDQNMRTMNLNHGINITDDFMHIIEQSMIDPDFDDRWELKQPNTGKVVEVVSARELWTRILEVRMQTGEPYLVFIDTANKHLPDYQKKQGLKINGSNLCLTGDTEIEVQHPDGGIEKYPLQHFVEMFSLGYMQGTKVKSFDQTTKEMVWSNVSAAAQTGLVDELYEITTPGGKIIRCTAEHKIYTKNRGFVEAKYLLGTDELLEI